MRLVTPHSLHYPITITKLLASSSDHVERNAPLFNYEFRSKVLEGSEETKEDRLVWRTWPSTFESYAEGVILKWHVESGRVVTQPGWVIRRCSRIVCEARQGTRD